MEQSNIFYLLLGMAIGGVSALLVGKGLLHTCNYILKVSDDKMTEAKERLAKSLATLNKAEEKYNEVIKEQKNLQGKYKRILEAAEKITLQ